MNIEALIKNPILNTDSYKPSHYLQYPPGTEYVESYIEPRSLGKFPAAVFAGVQPFIMEYMMRQITMEDVEAAAEFLKAHGEPFNYEGWKYIVEAHNGYLPIQIEAIPEGTVSGARVMQVRVRNTDPKCYWATSYVETALLRAIWYMSTVATVSFQIKKIIANFLDATADNLDGLPFKLHDFGARGVSSFESAGLGGVGHIMNFMGTDTMTAILFAKKYYNAKDMPAFSIPAAEHSSITSWGRAGEVDAYRNMIKTFAAPGALLAIVSDSYDIDGAVEIYGTTLKDEIVKSGATIVVRPDSGEPRDVVLRVVQGLDKNFGSVVNSKGYKVLNNVRVIQGDGINAESVLSILENLINHGYSADNVAFGMGGALLQAETRDSLAYAMKACAARINGEWIDVYKDPITDSGKKSKRGPQITAVNNAGELQTFRMEPGMEELDVMRVVYYKALGMDKPNIFTEDFDVIRARLNKYALKNDLAFVG